MNAISVRQCPTRTPLRTRHKLLSFPVALLLSFFLVALTSANGQVFTANVSGYVRDTKGTPMEEAAVSIVNTATKAMLETVTDLQGHYSFLQLMPGTYNLSIKAEGLNPYEVRAITLSANQSAEFSPKLEVLDASKKKTTVTPGHVTIDTQTPNTSVLLSADELAELPIALRNPLLFVHTVGGATAITTGATPTNTADQYSSRFGLNGGRQNSSQILIDGIAVNSLGRGDANVVPGLEAVREVQIVRDAYDVQYGAGNGTAINIITKGGSSTLHGSGFEFLRNDKFDANRWENNKYGVDREAFRRNQYGGNIAGPLGKKDSRFFFSAGYEALRQNEPTTEVATVPTELMKKGDFSKATNASGKLLSIYNPFTTKLLSGGNYSRTVFPNNVIPANLLNSAGLLVSKLYPKANAAGTAGNNGQYVGTSTVETRNNREDFRLDWVPTDHLSMFARGTRARQTGSVPTYFGNGADQTTGQREPRVGFTGGGVWSPDANSAYSLLIGASHWRDTQTTASQNYNGVSVGLPAATVALFQANTMPQFSMTGYQGLGLAADKANVSANYRGEISASRQYRQHSLKAGIGYQVQRWDPKNASSAYFNFTNGLTSGATASVDTTTSGNAIASLLLGAGASGTAPYNPGLEMSQKSYSLYVHDTYHLSPRLTITAGLRYEVQNGPKETHDRFSNFEALGTSPLASSTGLTLKGGLVYVSGGGALWKTDRNNVAPRLGVAYKLTNTSVFRMGYGVSFVPTSLSGLAASDGYSTTNDWVSTLGNAGFVPRYLLNNPYPKDLATPAGSSDGMSTGVGSAINANLKDHATGYVGNFSADLQVQVGANGVLDVGFASARGRKLSQGVVANINQLDPTYLAQGPELNRLVTNPFAGVITSGALADNTIAYYQLLLPYRQFTRVNQSPLTPNANSSFDAMLLSYRYKLSKDMSFQATYQWSKSIDNASESQGSELNNAVSNVFNLNGERSLSAHDVPKDLTVNFVYMLPFGRNKADGMAGKVLNTLVSGWQFSSVARLASGLPLQFYAANNLSTYGFDVQRPTITTLKALTDTSRSPDSWFDTVYIKAPQAYTIGDMPRYVGNVRTGATTNVDLSFSRSFNIFERLRLQFRAEAFNVTNTPTYGRANTTMGTSGFGTVTDTTGNPRNLQFGARLDF